MFNYFVAYTYLGFDRQGERCIMKYGNMKYTPKQKITSYENVEQLLRCVERTESEKEEAWSFTLLQFTLLEK